MASFSLEQLDARKFHKEREAFLQSIPDGDREEVDCLTRSYDSTRNNCGLNDEEKLSLVNMSAKYPALANWLF